MNAEPIVQQFDGAGDRGRFELSGAAQHRMLAGERDRGDEGLGHAVVRILDGVDRVGDRGEEALGLASHQRLDQVIAARVAAVGRHPGHACSADHILDRNPLQPNGSRFLKRGVEYALAGAVGRLVHAAAGGGAADDLDQLAVDHSAAAFGQRARCAFTGQLDVARRAERPAQPARVALQRRLDQRAGQRRRAGRSR